MLMVLEILWVLFAVYLAWFCIGQLKRFPRGILEYAVWLVAIVIIISWFR